MSTKKRTEPDTKKVATTKQTTKATPVQPQKKVKVETTPTKKVEPTKQAATTKQATPAPTKQTTVTKPTKQTTSAPNKQVQPTKQTKATKVEEEKPKSIIKKPVAKELSVKPTVETKQPQQPVKNIKKVKEVIKQTISVGCYENSILGYDATYVGDHAEEGFEVDLQMTYGYSSHTGCVKALGSTKNILVSSSTDETVKVYNLKNRVEVGQLQKHEGHITCIQFYKNTHMFASSIDNTISVWRVSDWECLKVMSGPKGSVNSISIHPSGKVALSVSKDRRLFLWDLTKGTSAHFLKFKTEGFIVQWSPSGNHYAVVFKDKVVVYKADNFEEVVSLEFKLQILAVKFFDDDTLMVGGDDKILSFIDYKNGGKITKTLEGHENRIKGIDTLKFKGIDTTYVVTISSDGLIAIWNPEKTNLPVGCVETGFRLTSLTVAPITSTKSIGDDNSDDDDDEKEEGNEFDEDYDSEEEEAIENQPSKKMKVNVEIEEDEEDDEDDDDQEEDDENEDEEEDDQEDEDEEDEEDDE